MVFPLSLARPGEIVSVESIAGGYGLQRKLSELGLYPGEVIRVVSSDRGPVVVEVKGSRVGIGYGMAKRIMVKRIRG